MARHLSWPRASAFHLSVYFQPARKDQSITTCRIKALRLALNHFSQSHILKYVYAPGKSCVTFPVWLSLALLYPGDFEPARFPVFKCMCGPPPLNMCTVHPSFSAHLPDQVVAFSRRVFSVFSFSRWASIYRWARSTLIWLPARMLPHSPTTNSPALLRPPACPQQHFHGFL